MAGYSGTPLADKLGIRRGARVGFRHAPGGFRDLLEPWPEGAVMARRASALDLVVLFAESARALGKEFLPAARSLTPQGTLWVAWPKKAAKVPTDLTEDRVRSIGLAAGLVDVKVCAIDEKWSGLKFVVRTADRAARRTAAR
jgi:hypothetical protein